MEIEKQIKLFSDDDILSECNDDSLFEKTGSEKWEDISSARIKELTDIYSLRFFKYKRRFIKVCCKKVDLVRCLHHHLLNIDKRLTTTKIEVDKQAFSEFLENLMTAINNYEKFIHASPRCKYLAYRKLYTMLEHISLPNYLEMILLNYTQKHDKEIYNQLLKAFEQKLYYRNLIVELNYRLVPFLLKNKTGQNNFQDLIQDGTIGLIRAAELYSPNMGAQFSTYASYWIKLFTSKAMSEKYSLIRLPIGVIMLSRKLIINKLEAIEQTDSLSDYIELLSNESNEDKKLITSLCKTPEIISLENTVYEKTKIVDHIPTPDDFLNKLDSQMIRKKFEEAILKLPDKEREILIRRHGFFNSKKATLMELSAKFGISHERIRHLEKRALTLLKIIEEPNKLKIFSSDNRKVKKRGKK